ncbi:MAG: GNAT family N-acetyltransferase [Planctomycetota bacterium]
MIVVRRATLADKPAIFEFIRAAFGDASRFNIPERWEWQYENNPFRDPSELPVWIAVDEDQGKIVGQTCAMMEPLKIGADAYRVGWSVDTVVLPECRGQGIGYRLQEANHKGNEVFMSLVMSETNRRIKARLGSAPIDPVAQFVKPVNLRPGDIWRVLAERLTPGNGPLGRLARWALRWLLLGRIIAGLLNLCLEVLDLWLMRSSDKTVVLTRVAAFGEEADQLWRKVSPCFHALVRRDAAYLNWKFLRQPHVDYLKFIAQRDGDICGYLILRRGKPPMPNEGVIVDFLVSPDDAAAIRAMLVFAARRFRKEGATLIRAGTSVAPYQKCLAELGFWKRGELTPLFHCMNKALNDEMARSSGVWLLGRGDHDWDPGPIPI